MEGMVCVWRGWLVCEGDGLCVEGREGDGLCLDEILGKLRERLLHVHVCMCNTGKD